MVFVIFRQPTSSQTWAVPCLSAASRHCRPSIGAPSFLIDEFRSSLHVATPFVVYHYHCRINKILCEQLY